MRTLKNTVGELGALLPIVRNTLGVLGALVPIAYFGGLLSYFENVGGAQEDTIAIGLGPTVIGLKILLAVGCLFLVARIVWGLRERYRPKRASRVDLGSPPPRTDGFDPDAIVARYIANQSASGDPADVAPALATPERAPDAAPTSGRAFGRKRI